MSAPKPHLPNLNDTDVVIDVVAHVEAEVVPHVNAVIDRGNPSPNPVEPSAPAIDVTPSAQAIRSNP
ncbi:MAG: hypothetical protein VKJ46_04360, partial [Leptolyngbyaceae bacterium]|nr:hypothetical protein [Leptolyngbyaceae bacterium]